MSATGCIDRLGSESHAHDCFCQAEESSASFLVSEHQRNKILSLCCSYLHFLCLYTFVSLLNVIIAVCRGQCILSRVLVFLWERATWTVESSVRVKSNFCGHSSSNSIFFSVSLSLGDKPLSFILDCYHKLVRGFNKCVADYSSALEDEVTRLHPQNTSPLCHRELGLLQLHSSLGFSQG